MKVRYSKLVGIKWGGIFAAVLLMWMITGQADVSAAQVHAGSWRRGSVCQIDGGWGHSIVLKSDGSVVSWGIRYQDLTDPIEEVQSGVVSVAAGELFSLALKSDGTVVAWGNDFNDECKVPEGLDDVIAISCGSTHSLALKSDGTVAAWGGSNYSGECNVPDGLNGVVDIAAGGDHSLALKSDGTIVAWGDDSEGQCTGSAGLNDIVAIEAGRLHSLALKSDGTVVAWGATNIVGQSTVPDGLNGVVSIAAGGFHSMALKSDGTIVAWGGDNKGQCTGSIGLNDIVAIAGAYSHSLALKSDGTVVAWGDNEYDKAKVPEGLSLPVKGKAVSTGDDYTLALKSDGSVVAWGNDEHGQSTVPVEAQSNVVAISAGGEHSLALKSDGTVVAWGNDSNGECTGSAGLSDVVAISAGLGRSLALKSDGTVAGWGNFGGGESLVIESLEGVTAIAVGGGHSLALKWDGTVVAWGRNNVLQIMVPNGLSGVIAISAGYEHSLALKSDGTVVGWGSNSHGQKYVPPGLNGVVAIEAGATHSLALKSDGTVVSWGDLDQSTVPEDLNGVLAISGGEGYTLALKADGTIAAWGDDSSGKATVPNSDGLSKLTIDLGDLSPSTFDSSVTEYSYSYAGASVASVNISGTLDNPDETELYIYGQKRESEAVVTVPLNETSTDIIVGVKTCFLPEKIYTVTVYRDMNAPTIVFGTNGSETYTEAAASTVTVSDVVSGVDASVVEYAWTTGTDVPESGWTSFTSGDTLTKSGADGDWYLHIKAADTAGNIAYAVSNRFRLDSAAPAASLVSPSGAGAAISTPNIVLGFSESVTGVEGGKITISDGSGTYTCTIGGSDDYITEIESEYRAVIPVSSFIYDGEPLVLEYDTTYTIALEAGVYIDVAGKETAAGDVGSFKTETVPASTVTVSANPLAGGIVSGSGTYSQGASVTVTATTGSGFVFVNWTEDGAEVSTSASYAFTIGTYDRDLVANFSAVSATLESIDITTLPTKLVYTVGESLDISGMVVTGTYSDSNTKVETVTAAHVTGFDSTTPAAIQVLTVAIGGKSDTYTVTINEVTAPAAPTIDVGGFEGTFTEDHGAAEAAPLASITDPDSTQLSQMVITLTNPENGGQEIIRVYDDDDDNITVTYNDLTQITLTGLADLSDYQNYLRSLKYENLSDSPEVSIARTITIVATDCEGNTGPAAVVMMYVVNVNDAPSLDVTYPSMGSTNEDTAKVLSVYSFLGSVTDYDGPIEPTGIAVIGVSGAGDWTYSTDGGTTWTSMAGFSEDAALLLRSTDLVSYTPNGTRGETVELSYRAWDQSVGTAGGRADTTTNGGTTAFSSDIGTATLTVTDVNDAPILAGGEATALCPTDEDTASGSTLVSDILEGIGGVSDVDLGAMTGVAVTAVSGNGIWQFSHGGSIWADFPAVSNDAALLLQPGDLIRYLPDHIRGETAFLIFRAWDQTSGTAGDIADTSTNGGSTAFSTDRTAATLTVTDVNDAPIRRTGIPAEAEASVTVNTAYTLNLDMIFEDEDTDTLTYKVSINGADYIAADSSYSFTPAETGQTVLVFKANDGIADSTDTYTVTLTANAGQPIAYTVSFDTDGGSSVDIQTVEYNDKAIRPADPTKKWYDFVGWYSNETLTTVYDFENTVIIEDTTIYARWTPATLQSIDITTLPVKLVYTVGDSLDISGMIVTGTYSDGSTKVEAVTIADINGFDSSTPAVGQVLTVAIGGKTDVYTVTIKAKTSNDNNNDNDNSNGSGGNGTGVPIGDTPAEIQKIQITLEEDKVTATMTVTAGADDNGSKTAAVTQTQVTEAVSMALEAASNKGTGVSAIIEVKVEGTADSEVYEVRVPKAAIDAIAVSSTDALTIMTPIAAITFDDKAIDTMSQEAEADVIMSAARVDSTMLSEEAKKKTGDRPVFKLRVTSGDKTISQFNGNVTVTVPYTPKAGEDINAVIIYYVNVEGKLETVTNGRYDAATGTVMFTTDHFSTYAVGYNKVSFNDVADNAWYQKAVTFIAAREITTGTGDGRFSPDAMLTRGQFITMAMRACNIAPDTDLTNNFADAGNTYYTGYLAAAKRLGISGGVGSNRFAPDKEISRQEMITLLYNTLNIIGKLPKGISKITLTDFKDAEYVEEWAKGAMELFVRTGVISGSSGRLNPTDTVKRSEMAHVLYNC